MGVAVTDTGDPLRTARQLRLSTAGAESTVAIGLRRLGHEAVWVGVVGEDELGARVLRDLAAEGVDTRFARVDPERSTGFMIRELRTADYTRVSYYREHSAGSRLSPADVEAAFSAVADLDLVHLTGITPALSESCGEAVRHLVELARRAGIPVSFDVNYRSTLPGSAGLAAFVEELLPQVALLFVGDDGALAVTADGGRCEQPALPARVVDAIGAGDSFTAGYLAARCDGLPLTERLRWGAVAAACTVGAHGDWEGLPARADLQRRSAGGSITVR